LEKLDMANLYEIHRYQHDTFQYIVAATNKYTEECVRQDVEYFNAILSNEMKSQGIRCVFATGSTRYNRNIRNENGKIKEHSS
jgi:uncharacterized protein with NAD-binding domain and iron-sulfur cluster